MQLDVWLAYVLAMIVISISPGSGCINTLSTSLSYGFRQALPAIAGLQVGLVVQLIVVGVGLGAILASSELAFMVLQWAGVGHLSVDWWIQADLARGAVGPRRDERTEIGSFHSSDFHQCD